MENAESLDGNRSVRLSQWLHVYRNFSLFLLKSRKCRQIRQNIWKALFYGLATHVPRRGFPHSFLLRLSLLSLYPNPHLIKMLLPSQNQQVEQISDGGTNISDPSSACNYLVITDFICGRAKCNLITDSYGFPPVACLGRLVRLHPKRILISRCPHGPLINRRVLHFDRFLLSRPSKSFLSLALSEVICMHA